MRYVFAILPIHSDHFDPATVESLLPAGGKTDIIAAAMVAMGRMVHRVKIGRTFSIIVGG
jgi:hypothetical protein